ncbi:MAG TPA: DUF1844 domain-containing protein [Bryobacteraceae bacterium]|nr:DUF1844 domain-containing protein [Bryobacteraceae bacterium]
MSEVETPKAQEDSRPYPLPPATFEFLIRSLVFQAQLSLGMMHFGEEKDAPKPDLEMSRHHIDILAMLQQKTKGNLTLEEQRTLENSLTELRFRYVQAVSEQQTAAPAGTSEPNQEASAAEGQQS